MRKLSLTGPHARIKKKKKTTTTTTTTGIVQSVKRKENEND